MSIQEKMASESRILAQPELVARESQRKDEPLLLSEPEAQPSPPAVPEEGEEDALLKRSKSQYMRKANGTRMDLEKTVQRRNYTE